MWRRRSTTAALVVSDAVLLWLLYPAVASAGAGLSAPQQWLLRDGADRVAVTLAAAGLWCVAAWVGLALLATVAAHLPGSAGRGARRFASAALPVVLQRIVVGSAGLGIVLTPITAASAAAADVPDGPGGRPVAAAQLSASGAPLPGPSWPGGGDDPIGASSATSAPATSAPAAPGPAAPGPAAPGPAWPAEPTESTSSTPAPSSPATSGPASPSRGSHPASSSGPTTTAPGPAWPDRAARPSASTSSPAPVPADPTTPSETSPPRTSPGVPTLPAPVRPTPPTPTATVRADDSLWLLGARRLGAQASDADIAAYVPELYRANRDVIGDDPDLVRPGQQLTLPAPDSATRVPGGNPP